MLLSGFKAAGENPPQQRFKAFYRAGKSGNRQTGGTGLGLYIVKTIFDLHGAKIEVANSAQSVITSYGQSYRTCK